MLRKVGRTLRKTRIQGETLQNVAQLMPYCCFWRHPHIRSETLLESFSSSNPFSRSVLFCSDLTQAASHLTMPFHLTLFLLLCHFTLIFYPVLLNELFLVFLIISMSCFICEHSSHTMALKQTVGALLQKHFPTACPKNQVSKVGAIPQLMAVLSLFLS